MSSILQEIAQQFDAVDPARAKELRRIEQVYSRFFLSDDPTDPLDDDEGMARRLLHFLSRKARLKEFRLYPIGVGEQAHGRYAHQAIALLDARHLPTPGNPSAVPEPAAATASLTRNDELRQYSFESWQDLQGHYGRGCALLP